MLKKIERHVAGLRLSCLVDKNAGTFGGVLLHYFAHSLVKMLTADQEMPSLATGSEDSWYGVEIGCAHLREG